MRIGIALLSAFALLPALTEAQGRLEPVEFVADSISDVNGRAVELLGGSTWLLSTRPLTLPVTDVVIVIREAVVAGRKVPQATFYGDNEQIPARHIDGLYVGQRGFLTQVVQRAPDGSVLRLSDNSLVSVPSYDRFDTKWWLPPYPALLTGSQLYLYNLAEGKRVWVRPVR